MPARGRSPAPSLPPVNNEATVPFSDLFKSGFDPATVDATTQLADRSIFVTSNGSRYRLERIPDDVVPVPGRVPTSAPFPFPPAAAQPFGFHTPSSTLSGSPASLPPPQLHVHAPPDAGPGWGRSASNASSYSRSSGAYSTRSGYAGGAIPGPDPRGPTHEVASMMANLHISRGFGATPFYVESDGGVHTAETLTDPDHAPRGAPMSPASLGTQAASSRVSYTQYEQPSHYQARSWGPHDYPSPSAAAPQPWTNVDYAGYYAHLERSRQRPTATGGFPSLLELATPLPPPHRASDPLSPISPDKEVWDGQDTGNGYYYPPLHPSVSAPPSFDGRQPSYVNIGPGEIDTRIPVVVYDPAHSTASDGASTGRDNVLPGEDLLFDGPVKSAQTLTAPVFREGVLKVFRNTLTNDLRFHCKVDRESETYRIKASNAQLVPAYAYDQRLSNVVYIRDKESDTGNAQGNCRPSGIYQFSSLKELFDFQARLTGEKVVLDIGSVRMVTLSKANSRSSTQFSSARLQIWHEAEGRRTAQSDVASFVTAGTALSGPLRERLVASSSRLMLYLGRSGGYITVFITDDLEIKAEGQTLVKLKPRKGPTPFSRKASRWQSVKARLEPSQGSEQAGFDIHGRAVEVDVGSDYDSYKTFEIEFENSPSQDGFMRKWDEVIKERRAQRIRLDRVQEEMESAVFTGRQARGVFM